MYTADVPARANPKFECHKVTIFCISDSYYQQSLSTPSMAPVPFHQNQAKVQEIIFYFSSRLRAATIATLDPANAEKLWLHHFLVWELVI